MIKIGGGFLIIAVLTAAWFEYRVLDRPIALPKPRGPYSVGRMLFDWTDTERHRELMVFVWYPALLSSAPAAEYVPGKWGELAAAGSFPIPARRVRQIQVTSRDGAEIVDAAHPLLILSPGMGRIPTDYTTLAEDLASFGYIVAGVTPPGSARVVVFSDGRVLRGDDRVDLDRPELAQSLIERWVGDFSFTVNRLLGDAKFKAHLDQHRIGVFGHSFGGAAAMHALQTNTRFQRAVNLDGAPQGSEIAHLDRPLLIVNGAPLPPSQKALNDRIAGEFHRICSADRAGCRIEEVPEAGHMNFSDAGALPLRFPMPPSHFNLTDIDGPAFLRKTCDLMRAFFDGM